MAASTSDIEGLTHAENNDEDNKMSEHQRTSSSKQLNIVPDQSGNSSVSSDKQGSGEIKPEEFKVPSFRIPIPKISKIQTKHADALTSSSESSNKSVDLEKDKSSVGEIKDSSISAEIGSNKHKKVETSSKRSAKSPAEKLASPPPVPYKEPSWSGVPEQNYTLDVLKRGCIISKIDLTDKPFHLFGRLDSCDVQLEHPSLSRYHAVLQYRAFSDDSHAQGFYLYDLNSTHGTYLNKSQLTPKVYYRMRVGYMFKFAGSSRLFILQGPDEDQEAESDLTVTELKELRQKQIEKIEALEKDNIEKDEEKEEERHKHNDDDTGVDWGMGEDAVEDESHENPFATLEPKEPLDLKDPKKTLRGYFEREGEELEYETEEKGYGHNRQFVCRVRLPIDDANGQPIYAEASVSGKKKDAVLACAAEACRILDQHGVLRQATHESKKRKAKDWAEDDYYDSDDDTFLDRTGIIEKKRLLRMKKAGKEKTVVDTYDSLTVKLTAITTEIENVEKELVEKQALLEAETASSEDALDAFMKSIKSGSGTDKVSRSKMKLKLFDLRKEQARLQRLIKIAMPTALPEIKQNKAEVSTKKETSKTVMVGKMPMVGSIKKGTISFKKFKTEVTTSVKSSDMAEEEEEDDIAQDKSNQVSMETNQQPQHEKDTPQDLVMVPDRTSELESSLHASNKQNTPDVKQTSVKTGIIETENTEEKQELVDKVMHDSEETKQSSTKTRSSNSDNMCDNTKTLHSNTQREESDTKFQSPSLVTVEKQRKESHSDKTMEKDKMTKRKTVTKQYDDEDDDTYSAWMPPKGQTGDGRTHLNDKYGY